MDNSTFLYEREMGLTPFRQTQPPPDPTTPPIFRDGLHKNKAQELILFTSSGVFMYTYLDIHKFM